MAAGGDRGVAAGQADVSVLPSAPVSRKLRRPPGPCRIPDGRYALTGRPTTAVATLPDPVSEDAEHARHRADRDVYRDAVVVRGEPVAERDEQQGHQARGRGPPTSPP